MFYMEIRIFIGRVIQNIVYTYILSVSYITFPNSNVGHIRIKFGNRWYSNVKHGGGGIISKDLKASSLSLAYVSRLIKL